MSVEVLNLGTKKDDMSLSSDKFEGVISSAKSELSEQSSAEPYGSKDDLYEATATVARSPDDASSVLGLRTSSDALASRAHPPQAVSKFTLTPREAADCVTLCAEPDAPFASAKGIVARAPSWGGAVVCVDCHFDAPGEWIEGEAKQRQPAQDHARGSSGTRSQCFAPGHSGRSARRARRLSGALGGDRKRSAQGDFCPFNNPSGQAA